MANSATAVEAAPAKRIDPKICVDNTSLETLKPGGELNDIIIDTALQMIATRSRDINIMSTFALSTYFYPTLMNKGYKSVSRWTRKDDIFSYDLILVPIHTCRHWSLVAIDIGRSIISYFDSLNQRPPKYCCETIILYLNAERLANCGPVSCDSSKWKIVTSHLEQHVPRQKNGHDCGMFVIAYADCLARNRNFSFHNNHMESYRIALATTMNQTNEAICTSSELILVNKNERPFHNDQIYTPSWLEYGLLEEIDANQIEERRKQMLQVGFDTEEGVLSLVELSEHASNDRIATINILDSCSSSKLGNNKCCDDSYFGHQSERHLYKRVRMITNHRECSETGDRLFEIGWFHTEERSWLKEADLTFCYDVVDDYVTRHKLKKLDMVQCVGFNRTLMTRSNQYNVLNWPSAASVLDAAKSYKNASAYRCDVEFGPFTGKLSKHNYIYLHAYSSHAFVYAHLAAIDRCYVIDGGNMFIEDPNVREYIMGILNIKEVIGLRFDRQYKVDHCGPTAASVMLECRRSFRRNEWPDPFVVCSRLYDRLVKRLCKYKSDSIGDRNYSIAEWQASRCPYCNWSRRKINRYQYESHVRACRERERGQMI